MELNGSKQTKIVIFNYIPIFLSQFIDFICSFFSVTVDLYQAVRSMLWKHLEI